METTKLNGRYVTGTRDALNGLETLWEAVAGNMVDAGRIMVAARDLRFTEELVIQDPLDPTSQMREHSVADELLQVVESIASIMSARSVDDISSYMYCLQAWSGISAGLMARTDMSGFSQAHVLRLCEQVLPINVDEFTAGIIGLCTPQDGAAPQFEATAELLVLGLGAMNAGFVEACIEAGGKLDEVVNLTVAGEPPSMIVARNATLHGESQADAIAMLSLLAAHGHTLADPNRYGLDGFSIIEQRGLGELARHARGQRLQQDLGIAEVSAPSTSAL